MTQVAEIQVAHLYPPYQGKGKASIVAHDGTKYKCEESQLAQFKEGERCAINYTTESFTSKQTGQHVTYNKLQSKIQTQTNGAQKQYTRPATAPREARQIGILATAKLVAPVPFTDPETLADNLTIVLTAATRAYDRTLNGAQVQAADDMSDEIPF